MSHNLNYVIHYTDDSLSSLYLAYIIQFHMIREYVSSI